MTHEWEELFIVRFGDDYENVYAGVDLCKNCKALRYNTEGGSLPDWVKTQRPYFYMARGWLSPEEPDCDEP